MSDARVVRRGRGQPATVPLGSVLAADARIWRTSSLLLAPVVAGALAVVTTLLLVSTGEPTWDRFLAHLNMWVVVLGPGFLSVVAGHVAARERAEGRGVAARAVHPGTRTVAGVVLLLTVGGAMHLAHVLVAVVAHAVVGSDRHTTPAGTLLDALTVAVALTVGGAVGAVVLRLAGEAAGMGGCLAAGFVLVLTGVLWAEHHAWWAVPSTWSLRAALPLIGTHANGVALQGEPLPGGGWAVVASVVTAALLCVVRAAWADRRPRRARAGGSASDVATTARRASTWGRLPAVGAHVSVVALRRSGVPTLAVTATALVVLLGRYREPGEVALVVALLVLPLGCGLLPVLVLPRWRSGLRAVAVRGVRVERLAAHLLATLVVAVVLVVLALTGALLGGGLAPGDALTLVPAWVAVGAMLTMLSAVLVSVGGTVVSLLVTVSGTTAGLLVGGNEGFRETFGLLVPWAWPVALGAGTLRTTVPVAVLVSLLLAAVAVRTLSARTSRMG